MHAFWHQAIKDHVKMHAFWHQTIKDHVKIHTFWHHDGENGVNSDKNAGRQFAGWYPSAVKRNFFSFSLLFYQFLRRFETIFFHAFLR